MGQPLRIYLAAVLESSGGKSPIGDEPIEQEFRASFQMNLSLKLEKFAGNAVYRYSL